MLHLQPRAQTAGVTSSRQAQIAQAVNDCKAKTRKTLLNIKKNKKAKSNQQLFGPRSFYYSMYFV